MPSELTAKWKIYKTDNGKFQLHKLKDDGSKGEAVGPSCDSRDRALAYQRALYKNVPDATASEQLNDMNSSTNHMSGSIYFEADENNPRLLHFKNYILARPETNKNKDRVDEQGIKELASTIAGMPIDYNHDPAKNVGTFTAGRVGQEGELRVDGIIWLDRCDANGVSAEDVLKDRYGMSVEAEATTAECSLCHKVHTNESQYCEHLRIQGKDQGIRSKLKYGAERIMRGLRAMGGAFTYSPAGNGTGADGLSGMVFCASHVDLDVNELESVDRREEVSPADDTEPAKSDNTEKASMSEEDKKETTEEEKKANYAKMSEDLRQATVAMEAKDAELETVKAEKVSLEAQVSEMKANLESANNTIKAHRTTELKSRLVGSVMEEEEFDTKVEKLLTLDAEVIDLMVRNRKVETPADGKLKMAASDQSQPAVKLY